MFKVELEFDKTLPKETVNSICDQVDEIFAEEGIPCAESSFGKRVYRDIHGNNDWSYMWASLSVISLIDEIKKNIIKAKWFNNNTYENLLDGFFN